MTITNVNQNHFFFHQIGAVQPLSWWHSLTIFLLCNFTYTVVNTEVFSNHITTNKLDTAQ